MCFCPVLNYSGPGKTVFHAHPKVNKSLKNQPIFECWILKEEKRNCMSIHKN